MSIYILWLITQLCWEPTSSGLVITVCVFRWYKPVYYSNDQATVFLQIQTSNQKIGLDGYTWSYIKM